MCAMKPAKLTQSKDKPVSPSENPPREDITQLLLFRARPGIQVLWFLLVAATFVFVLVRVKPINYGMLILLLTSFILVELGTQFFPLEDYRPFLFFLLMCISLALISSIVYFTGNRESLLGFLFLAVPIYAAAYYGYAGTLLISGLTAFARFIPFFSGNIEPVQLLSLALSAVTYLIFGLMACYIVEHEKLHARESFEFRKLPEVSRAHESEISEIYDLSRRFSYTLDLDTVLKTTAALAHRMLSSMGTLIFLVEEGKPVLKAALGIAPFTDMSSVLFPADEDWCRPLSLGENVIAEEVQLQWLSLPPDEQEKPHNIAAVPLFFGREVAGCLMCFSPVSHPFQQVHVDILSTLASQAAVAIEKAHLYTRTLEDKIKLETILSALRDGLLVADSAGILLQANAVAERMLKVGTSAVGQELLGLLQGSVRSADFGEYNLEEALESALVGHAISGEITFTGDDRLTVQAHFIPHKDRLAGVSGVILFLHDITDLKRLDEMKSNFVSNVSHELRTPLTSISGYVDLLLVGRAGSLTSKQEKYLSVVKEQATNLTKMIEDLLDLSRLKSPEVQVLRQKTSITEAVDNAVERLIDQAGQKGIKIETKVPSGIPPAAADSARITQVLVNILENAIKFTARGGLVEISALSNEPYIQVQVTDNGIGIPPTSLPLIFDRFFQAGTGDSGEPGGFGLGLAISREIVELYGGSTWAESEPGQGSTFFFTLPIYGEDLFGD